MKEITPGQEIWKKFLSPIKEKGIILLVILLFSFAGFSQHPYGFLDGDVINNDSKLDWANVYTNTDLPAGSISTGIQFDVMTPDDIFTGGSTKDHLPISGWLNKLQDGSSSDKTNILQGGAILIDGRIYFFGNRFSNEGATNIGFWFFQDDINILEGSFEGVHQIGDILVVAEITNGGAVGSIAAYQWRENAANGGTEPSSEKSLIKIVDEDTPQPNLLDAVVNSASATTPWSYQAKGEPIANVMPPVSFFEGFINIAGLNLTNACFSSFLVETRSSFSLTSILEDFLGSNFNVQPLVEIDDLTDCEDEFPQTLTAEVSGGIPPFTFEWKKGGVVIEGKITSSISVSEAGLYSVTVTGNGIGGLGDCVSEPDTATVTIIDLPDLVISEDDITCNSDADGTIFIPANDYSLKLFKSTFENGTYVVVNNPDTDVDGNYINLDVGWYYVEATESVELGGDEGTKDCSSDSNKVEITEPEELELSINGDSILCHGDADGNITGTVSGGTAPYTVKLSGDATDSQQVLTDGGSYDFDELSGGDYTVTVKDANYTTDGGSGCSTSKDAEITEPEELELSINGDSILCHGDADGNITGTVSGGTAPYTVELSGDATDSQQVLTDGGGYDFDELSGGDYTVTVKDANYTTDGGSGCSISKDASVVEAGEITLVVNGDSILCHGDADGNITGTVSGGTAPYTVELSGDATDSQQVLTDGGSYDFDELSGGDYTITVKDANYTEVGGCSTSKDTEITEPEELELSINGDSILCHGDADGNITGTISGGTAPYTVELSGDATDSQQVLTDGGSYDFDELSGGDYTVTVKDANYTEVGGCSTSKDAEITEPEELELSINGDSILCHGDADGNITGTVSGGTAPYTVELSGDATDSQQVLTDGGGYDFDELSGGDYTVTVKDANYTTDGGSGCSISKDASVVEAGEITLVVNGDSILCHGDADGNITGTVSGGTAPYTVELSGDATDSQQVLTDGGSYDFDELSGGDYTITVKDANYTEVGGCSTSKDTEITEPEELELSINGDSILCHGDADGNITGTVSGGTAPYTVELSGDATDSQQVLTDGGSYDFDELSGGDYTVTVKDANYTEVGGCSTSKDASIMEPGILTINLDSSFDPSCSDANDGSINITVSGGTLPYKYDWADLAGDNNIEDRIELSGGSYSVIVTDANGCTVSSQTILLETPTAIEGIATPGDETCDLNDGSITISPSGGSGGYTFDWADLPGADDPQNRINLAAGTYEVTIMDGNECTVTLSDIVVNEPVDCQEFEGCTLGYWKNHTNQWSCYSTCTPYSEVFGDDIPSELEGKTLLQVLNLGGGGVYNLGRQSVAALLNICNIDVNYEILTEAELVAYVQDNFNNAGAAGSYLDELNNAGCTLGGSKATSEPSEGCDEPEDTRPGKGKPAKNSSSVTSGFIASPVPFKENLTIQYDFEYTSNVTIQVYDLRGQLLRSYKDSRVTKGDKTELDVDFRMKANQVYILRVATDRDVFSKSVISSKR